MNSYEWVPLYQAAITEPDSDRRREVLVPAITTLCEKLRALHPTDREECDTIFSAVLVLTDHVEVSADECSPSAPRIRRGQHSRDREHIEERKMALAFASGST